MKKLCILLVLIPSLSFGWGAEGHRIIGAITDMYLNSIAKSKLKKLIGDQSIADVSNWLDQKRDTWDGARPFHYISMPPDATSYEPAYCESKGICAMSMIDKYMARLMDKKESPESRGEAIKIMVHLFQDLHMPLHTGGQKGDYGGNSVKIDFLGKKSNLHKVFDTNIIQYAKRTDEEWVSYLTKDLSDEKIAAIQKGTLTDWVNESHQYVTPIYEHLPKKKEGIISIDEEYANYGNKIIEKQLLDAGLRLANYLNQALGKVVIY